MRVARECTGRTSPRLGHWIGQRWTEESHATVYHIKKQTNKAHPKTTKKRFIVSFDVRLQVRNLY